MLKVNISLKEPVGVSRTGFKKAYSSYRMENRNTTKAQDKVYKNRQLIGSEMDEMAIRIGATCGKRTKALCAPDLYKAVEYAHRWRTYGLHPQETIVQRVERRRFITEGYKFKRCLKEEAC